MYNLNGHTNTNRSNTAVVPSTSQAQTVGNLTNQIEKVSHLGEKIVFVISFVSVLAVGFSLVKFQWWLPYYYSVCTPLLIGLRVVMYIKFKYQYFLLDFCYFCNTALYIYLWASPSHQQYMMLMFALTNGPVACGSLIFRNSLVFHSYDKMTSVYIHIVPMCLTYCIRWYSTIMSKYWYTPFVFNMGDDDLGYVFIWIFAIPFACYIFHTLLYTLVVYAICKPDPSYLTSFRYLSTGHSLLSRLINHFGEKWRYFAYQFLYNLYIAGTLFVTVGCYQSFIIHSIYICLITLCITWNGSSFYMDVFAVKGFTST